MCLKTDKGTLSGSNSKPNKLPGNKSQMTPIMRNQSAMARCIIAVAEHELLEKHSKVFMMVEATVHTTHTAF